VDDEVMQVSTPEQFKALAHPMRHRLLFALGQRPATLSQLAASLGSHKGNIAHHLKVLSGSGLIRSAGTRQVRGGTEQYYERAAGAISYSGPQANTATAAAFQAIADEIAQAEPDPFLVLRTLRLTPDQLAHITTVLTDLSKTREDADEDCPRYGLLLGLYQPHQQPAATTGR
jgi:DNA-binding transcriptional ArsR family regulator